jgi:hypothetical protein
MSVRHVGAIIIASLLSGCSYFAANQVLGTAATPIPVKLGQRIEAGGIYEFTEKGGVVRHCVKDFQTNSALKGFQPKVELSDPEGSRIDDLGYEDASVSIPGLAFKIPYDKSKVEGILVKGVSLDGERVQDFVYRGVGKKCRDLLDKGAVVVLREARAAKSVRLIRISPVEAAKLGILSLSPGAQERQVPGPQNVTFGIVDAKNQ